MSMMVSFFLAAMDLNGLAQDGGDGGDLGAFVLRVAAVEDEDRDVLLHGGQDRGRVQDLGAEVGELGGLFKADGLHAQRLGDDARIGGHDAVDVGPDLDGAGVQRAADEGGGVVGAAAAERGGDAVRRSR